MVRRRSPVRSRQRAPFHAPVAQWIEQPPSKRTVTGSNPVGGARRNGPDGPLPPPTYGPMSVTFTFAASDGDATAIGVLCDCRSKLSCACEDFEFYGLCEHTGDGECEHNRFDVSMSNGNAQQVLTGLGFDFDYSGVQSAATFLDRLATADNVHRHGELARLATEAKAKRLSIGWG